MTRAEICTPERLAALLDEPAEPAEPVERGHGQSYEEHLHVQ